MSTGLLSEEELAALQEGVDDGSIAVDTGYNTRVRVRKHDLASEDSTLGINVGAIEMINERLLRLFRLGLVEVLRSTPKIAPLKSEIVRYGDYLKMLKAPLSVNMIRMNPLRGFSLVVIEPQVIFSSLDVFFGGFGSASTKGPLPPTRLFTPTESRVISIILDIFYRALKDAWSPVLKLDIEQANSEINPQFAQIADENDLVVLSRFEIDNSKDTFIDLVHPYASLKPIRDVLRSRVQTGDGNDESDKAWRRELTAAVDEAELELRVVFGELDISLQQLQSFQPGDLLYFKKPDWARAYLCGVPAFEVEVGSAGHQVACRIVKSIRPEADA